MSLSTGARIGPYEIVAAIGAGGMGEVYRARDSHLNRDVAIKILPEAFALDPDRVARFKREAQVVASLNHQNIAAIYGFEESAHALVLELVEGPTLADRIAQGPIPVDEALAIASQIADALEAAHERGIVHRDLKPANIKLRDDGTVKVLDFGLAKLAEAGRAGEAGWAGGDALSMSPTITSPALMTGVGVLLGTAGYMSPEQAKGKPADRQSDIWAFGCVLFEMLTGTRAFAGEDTTDVIAAIVRGEPDWSKLPQAASPAVRQTLRRCLEKDRANRFHDIGDVRLALDGAFESRDVAAAPVRSRHPIVLAAGIILIAAVAAGATWALSRPRPAPATPIRFDLPAPDGNTFTTSGFSLSPDGHYLAFIARNPVGRQLLWFHDFTTGQSRPLTTAFDVGNVPIWAPDSRHLLVFGDGKLRKMDVDGGPSQIVCEGGGCGGTSLGSWDAHNTVVLGHSTAAMTRLDLSAATSTPLTVLDATRHERGHTGPRLLPDGDHFLYTRISTEPDESGLFVGSLSAKPEQQDMKMLVQTPLSVSYVPSTDPRVGYVLYMREGTLFSRAFDNQTLKFAGDAMPVAEQIGDNGNATGFFSVAAAGTLVVRRGGRPDGEMVWVDRGGREAGSLNAGVLKQPEDPRLSPDGRRVALTINRDVWVYDLNGRPPIKLTFDGAHFTPLWTLDGRRLVYETSTGLLSLAADGSDTKPAAVSPAGHFHAYGWSADGKAIVAVRLNAQGITDTNTDIVTIPVQQPSTPQAVVATGAQEGFDGLAVSPDGHWLAYDSNTTGRLEIWVQPFPGPGAPIRISPNGGTEPVWARNGKELFYLGANKMMAVTVDTRAGFTFKPPTPLFENHYVVMRQPPSYDVSSDGRFLMIRADAESLTRAPMQVTINWLQSMNAQAAR